MSTAHLWKASLVGSASLVGASLVGSALLVATSFRSQLATVTATAFGILKGLHGRFVSSLPVSLLRVIEPRPEPKGPHEPTTLLLVRHGQSMHNISSVAQHSDQGADETLYDAPLSPLGEEQVAALLGHLELASAELVITSPMTRAVQTLFGAFPKAPSACPPVEVWALAAEHLTDSCDIGSGARDLAKAFPSLKKQISALPEVWWYTDDETSRSDPTDSRRRYKEVGFMEPELTLIQRVRTFADALRARPERTIAVFGHSDYFNFLMENHCGVADYWLENAEVYKVILPPAEEKA